MARLSLQQRVTRYGPLLSRDPTSLSKKDANERGKLIRAMGTTEAKWDSYKPRTRRDYINAAKRGTTSSVVRKERRANRKARERAIRTGTPRDRIRALAREARDLINLYGDANTHYDENVPEHRDLLDDESIDDFVRHYGEKYVEAKLRQVITSVDAFYRGDKTIGQRRWFAYQASEASEEQDERWWWYHAGTVHIA